MEGEHFDTSKAWEWKYNQLIYKAYFHLLWLLATFSSFSIFHGFLCLWAQKFPGVPSMNLSRSPFVLLPLPSCLGVPEALSRGTIVTEISSLFVILPFPDIIRSFLLETDAHPKTHKPYFKILEDGPFNFPNVPISSCLLELPVKYPKLRVLGPSFALSGDELRSRDENCMQVRTNRGQTCFLTKIGRQGSSTPRFGLALPAS